MTKVCGFDAAACIMLWQREGCSPWFCSGVLTSEHLTTFGTALRDLLGKPLGEARNAVLPHRIQKHIVSKQNISFSYRRCVELPSAKAPCTRPLHSAGWLSLQEAAMRCETQLQDTAMQSPYPYTSSYREGGRAASLLM